MKKKIDKKLENAIVDITWMARRYAEGRKTGAPDMFNEAYKVLKEYVEFNEKTDPDNRTDESRPIKNFPWATRGEY